MITVKFLSNEPEASWLHQFPDNKPVLNNCEFIFDEDAENYDWLVVYEDLPKKGKDGAAINQEQLLCHPDNTLLVTSEPSSIKLYGTQYTKQFGHVLTSQSERFLPHKDRHYGPSTQLWFYGLGAHRVKPYNTIVNNNLNKTESTSVVWSNKKQIHSNHRARFKFLNYIGDNLQELSVFGQDNTPLDDKSEAIISFKYHIAIENYYGPHHWTEKLADSFLGLSLPFYYGCPNLDEYFPQESFIRIDINKPKQSLDIMLEAINNNEYERRKQAVIEAKRRLLEQHNLFIMLTNIIRKKHCTSNYKKGTTVYSRRLANRSSMAHSLTYITKKAWARSYYITRRIFNK